MYFIGTILKPQGIKGELKVQSVSPDPDRFYRLEKIFMLRGEKRTFVIENVRIVQGFVFLKLAGIDSRNEAELLRGQDLYIAEEQLIDLDSGEYFIHDLVGCEVVTENGRLIGKIVDVMQELSSDIYIVQDQLGNEYLIPAIKDIVLRVDIKLKRVDIHVIEGLLD